MTAGTRLAEYRHPEPAANSELPDGQGVLPRPALLVGRSPGAAGESDRISSRATCDGRDSARADGASDRCMITGVLSEHPRRPAAERSTVARVVIPTADAGHPQPHYRSADRTVVFDVKWLQGMYVRDVLHALETCDGSPRRCETGDGSVLVAVCRAWLVATPREDLAAPRRRCERCCELIGCPTGDPP